MKTIPVLIFIGVILAAGNIEHREAQDKFDHCLKTGVFLTDSDIENRIQECEYQTGYTMPDNLRP